MNNNDFFLQDIIYKIYENIYYSSTKGIIIASPSNDPPYKFHWIRDSALVMRVILSLIENNIHTKDNLIRVFDYIELEHKLQNAKTLSGLGEPKFNIDGSVYNEPWGRPQNDGPALRGLNLLKILKLLEKDYPNLVKNQVIKMIDIDLKYILLCYKDTCFDLWEENIGYHFYTRVVQYKFLKECLKSNLYKNQKDIYQQIKDVLKDFKEFLKHHNGKEEVISSFDEFGNVSKLDDASIMLGICHTNFDKDIMDIFPIENLLKNCENLHRHFREKYNDVNVNLVGRYFNDAYYNGHAWIICSLALAQFYNYIHNTHEGGVTYLNSKKLPESIFDYIRSININLDLSEQFDVSNQKMLSAEKLTWNYSELYWYMLNINNKFDIE